MKQLALAIIICMAVTKSFAQSVDKEKLVRAYYNGYQTHNWILVSDQFAN